MKLLVLLVSLSAGGSTAMGDGIKLAYEQAALAENISEEFVKVRLRYKDPKTDTQISEIQQGFDSSSIKQDISQSSRNFILASLVGRFSENLRDSPFAVSDTLKAVARDFTKMLALDTLSESEQELFTLIQQAQDVK